MSYTLDLDLIDHPYRKAKVTWQDLIDDEGDGRVYYNLDNNLFYTPYGDPIFNLWDFFKPEQLEQFKDKGGPSKWVLTRQRRFVELVAI